MSSYLTFYIVPKEEGSKPIALLNYSRNNDIYQYFVDNVRVAFVGMEENPQYTELTEEKIDWVIHDLKYALSETEFIKQFVTEATHSWSDYNKVLCNVD